MSLALHFFNIPDSSFFPYWRLVYSIVHAIIALQSFCGILINVGYGSTCCPDCGRKAKNESRKDGKASRPLLGSDISAEEYQDIEGGSSGEAWKWVRGIREWIRVSTFGVRGTKPLEWQIQISIECYWVQLGVRTSTMISRKVLWWDSSRKDAASFGWSGIDASLSMTRRHSNDENVRMFYSMIDEVTLYIKVLSTHRTP